ncbi:MAG TPA: aldehyde dehydrogenase family protein, partial [Solirubrobacterales bacterium]|nr:aldehyde dehydrogenase family protein [Solirubrobacterales bacterium]
MKREVPVESGTIETSTEAINAANGANGAGAADQFEVHNPATGDVIASVPIDSPQAVAETVARVRANQPEWEAMGIEGRYHWLGKLRDWLLDNQQRVLDTMQAETGKVRPEASNEPVYLADLINFYGSKAARFIGEEAVRPHSPLLASKKLRIQYRPHPVVGIISPWNFPLILALGDAIPAMQAGAAVVIKPSEFTPLGVAEVVEAWKEEIGGPDVFDCVQGIGETGGALVDAADFIQFTGSDRTGRKVMARAAETLTPVSLELGGKDPMIVLSDADLDRAANAASWGGMMNSGQICMSVERIYVEEPAYDEFVAKLTAEVGRLRQGADDGTDPKDVGAMTSPR